MTTCNVDPAGRYCTLLNGVGVQRRLGNCRLYAPLLPDFYRKLHGMGVARMDSHSNDAALIVIDLQNDVLSESDISRELVGASVKEINAIENLARLFSAAKQQQFAVFISPQFLRPFDRACRFAGAVEAMMLEGNKRFRPVPRRLKRIWRQCGKESAALLHNRTGGE